MLANKRHFALAAATLVAIIYGVTFTVAKDVMPKYIAPYGFILVRVSISVVLFWITWLFGPKEKIDQKDYLRITLAAFFGVAFNMLTFFKGLSLTSQISASVLMVTTPIIVLILSAFIIKERLSFKKTTGIGLGLFGAFLLITNGKFSMIADEEMWGNFLVFINAVSYGLYLVLVKKLMDKYNALSFVPYIYTLGLMMVLPFGINQVLEVQWENLPGIIWFDIFFVVVFSTYLTYLLNLISMRVLSPTTVAVFIYLQPLFATVFAISLGKDYLTITKVLAGILVFGGVYLVTKKTKDNSTKSKKFYTNK